MKISLNPLLAVAWRGPGRVQIGVDPQDGFILDGITPVQERLLDTLRAGTDTRALRRLGVRLGAAREDVDEFVQILAQRGALLSHTTEQPTRLLPVAAGLPASAEPDRPWQILRRRAAASVLVVGGGSRAGLELVRLLQAEGVGRVLVDDETPVSPADVHSGPYLQEDLGRPRMQVLGRRLPGVRACGVRDPERPDLGILIGDWALSPQHWEPLLRADVPHLAVVLRDRGAQVGPYVVPGRTGCLRCTEMYRADRDPEWVPVLTQLAEREATSHRDLLLRLVTATACAQALLGLDGTDPATLGSTLELSLTNPVPTLRAWPAHARCGCTWESLMAHA